MERAKRSKCGQTSEQSTMPTDTNDARLFDIALGKSKETELGQGTSALDDVGQEALDGPGVKILKRDVRAQVQ